MTKVERQGLILLALILLTSTLLCAFFTGGGRAFGNIFYNIVSYIDERPLPTSETEAQYESFRQQLGVYWVIAGVTVCVGLLTLAAVGVYVALKRQTPRSWCLLLAFIGGVAIGVALLAGQLQTAVLANPEYCVYCNATRDGLAMGAQVLTPLAFLGGGLLVVGLGMFAWSTLRRAPVSLITNAKLH